MGEDAGIETFCTTFLDIFADKYTTAGAQKKTALRLWCMHNGRKVITASINLPADELELFELAWNAEALARCRGCKGEVVGVRAGFHVHDPYCCEKCRIPAGMQIVCWKCKKPATMVGDWLHCETCFPSPPNAKRKHELSQSEKSLMLANRMFRFGMEKMEGEAPRPEDTKRRKRA